MIYSYVYNLDLVGKYIKVSISQLPISHRGKSFSYNKRGKKRTKGGGNLTYHTFSPIYHES